MVICIYSPISYSEIRWKNIVGPAEVKSYSTVLKIALFIWDMIQPFGKIAVRFSYVKLSQFVLFSTNFGI